MSKFPRLAMPMMIVSLIIFLNCLLIPVSSAQISTRPVFCGNEVFSKILQEKYPLLKNAFDSTFESIRTASGRRTNEPLDVNVVVHIVWNAPEENLADSIVYNQIAILNSDYNRHNSDSSHLRNLFKPEAGNANIHFHLAGIVRVKTNVLFNVDLFGTNLLAEAKHEAEGGSDAWDPAQYLNIWVCNIQPIVFLGVTVGQILGFAFPPNNLQNWPADSGAPTVGEDGVAIDYRVFGGNNPNTIENPDGSGQIVVKGRTTVHEVGHYFGLRHIWGDGGLLGPNDCAQSDGVDDTPFANTQSAFDCDTTKNTCTQVEAHYNSDVPDLIENFMDYASEDCMNMFTHGQVELMRNTLTESRNGLLVPLAGTHELNQIEIVSIAPNPSDGRFSMNINFKQPADIGFAVLSLSGQELYHIPAMSYGRGVQKIDIDLSGISTGMYFLQIRSSEGIGCEKLFIH